jgi:hypothetical protein
MGRHVAVSHRRISLQQRGRSTRRPGHNPGGQSVPATARWPAISSHGALHLVAPTTSSTTALHSAASAAELELEVELELEGSKLAAWKALSCCVVSFRLWACGVVVWCRLVWSRSVPSRFGRHVHLYLNTTVAAGRDPGPARAVYRGRRQQRWAVGLRCDASICTGDAAAPPSSQHSVTLQCIEARGGLRASRHVRRRVAVPRCPRRRVGGERAPRAFRSGFSVSCVPQGYGYGHGHGSEEPVTSTPAASVATDWAPTGVIYGPLK